jgi:hypothetical protein
LRGQEALKKNIPKNLQDSFFFTPLSHPNKSSQFFSGGYQNTKHSEKMAAAKPTVALAQGRARPDAGLTAKIECFA